MQKFLLTLVIAVTLVLASLTAAFAAPPVLKDRNSLTVVDAHGVKVGDLFSGDTINGFLAFEVDQQPFVLRVSPQGLAGAFTTVVFNSNNCSGPPLIFRRDETTFPAAFLLYPANAIDGPGRTLYLEDPAADPFVLQTFSGSQLDVDGTCRPASTTDPSVFVPVQPIIDLDTLFTPPFSVR
jgi:hypothetical protein